MTKRAEFTKDFTRKVVRLAETSGQARKEATEDGSSRSKSDEDMSAAGNIHQRRARRGINVMVRCVIIFGVSLPK